MKMKMRRSNQKRTSRETSLPMGTGVHLKTLPRRPGALSPTSRSALLRGLQSLCLPSPVASGSTTAVKGDLHVDAGPQVHAQTHRGALL